MEEIRQLLWQVNLGIIRMRGAYAAWCREQGISYHELLVFYSLYYHPEDTTQRTICTSYLLPKQTVHHVVASMVRAGWLLLEPSIRSGREKRLVPTARGWERIRQVMEPLTRLETDAVERMGRKEVAEMVRLMERYSGQLNPTAEEEAV